MLLIDEGEVEPLTDGDIIVGDTPPFIDPFSSFFERLLSDRGPNITA